MAFQFRGSSSLLALGIFFVALMTIGLLALQKQRAFDDVLLEDAVWATFQLDRELKSLRIALLEATPETIPAVKLNYDILYSRINVLERGQVADLVQQVPLRDHDLDALLDRIKSLDEPISALSPERLTRQRADLSESLEAIQTGTKDLVVKTNLHFAERRQESREGLVGMIRAVLIFAAMALIAGLVLVRQLRQQRASIESRRHELEVSNRELEKARREAEQASKAKTDFMAVLSHEVRTPLNGIFGLTDILQKELGSASKATRYLQTLRASADAVFTVVNDILDYSRIQAGKLSLTQRAFSLDAFLDTLCQGYRIQAGNGRVAFESDYPPELGHVHGDPDRLRQVLMNLINNAFKFTDEGRVSLRLDAQRLSRGLDLCFTVSDTGCGIDEADQRKLFQPFSQVDTSLTRAHQGSGLGLVISKELVERMGGRVGVESQPGAGSRFTVQLLLPVADPPAVVNDEPPSIEDTPSTEAAARVLVVEDNPVNQLVAREQLTRIGHRVTVVENGQAALDCIGDAPFDLVLMDMQMPVMDGIEATQRMRARGEALPIIAMTANAMDEDGQRCLDAGMQAVIKKPVNPEELQRTLAHYLGDDARFQSR